ncbi:hypothetical protein [Aurantiacibacter luteus]|uniref:hypothetical protein n=1 Tax=Aurantiacibacter luteus TaxID=1581420 RepID=UPI00069B89B4|nr:hypothetical protein [Aurantiacibacter luteus]
MDRRRFFTSAACAAVAAHAVPAFAQRGGAPDYDWQIGPVIRGRNYSVNMPDHPIADGRGWYFDFPGPRASDGHVHYITRATGPLGGARGIRFRYRIDARPGVRFVPQETPDLPGTVSLYLQAAGDDWRGRGRSEFSRWYSPNETMFELSPGVHEHTVMFDDNWISVMGSNRQRNPREFDQMLDNAGTVGLTFGSRMFRGHGVFATQPARFTLLDFSVF